MPCGRHGRVWALLYPRICCNWYISLFSKSAHCSLLKVSGEPKMLISRSFMTWGCFGRFTVEHSPEPTPRTISGGPSSRLHSTTAAEVDTDLYSITSTDILRRGRSTGKWPIESFGPLCAVFRRRQARPLSHPSRTSRVMIGHQYTWQILAQVGRITRRPPGST